MKNLVIDASVWIAAFLKGEIAHRESRDLLFHIPEGTRIHISTFALWEITTALFRRTGDRSATERAMKLVIALGTPEFHLFDSKECQASFPDLLYKTGLRAADLIYVSLARSTESLLVTLDEEMSARSRKIVKTMTPAGTLHQLQNVRASRKD